MALPVAYRNQLGVQFLESFLYFIYKKRVITQLLAKVDGGGTLTAEEANILIHYQQDVAHDRGVFGAWKNLLINEEGYTLAQIKTWLLNNRTTVMNMLRDRYDAEISAINTLKDEETADATTEEDIANLPTLLAELDIRISKRQMWRALVIELRDMLADDFAAESELT